MSGIEMDPIKNKVNTSENNINVSTCDNNINDETKPSKVFEYINTIKTYKAAIGATLFFCLVVIIIIIISMTGEKRAMAASEDGSKVFAHTSCGRVEGLMDDSSFAFRGIPFARSPIGDLRFRFAQPLDRIEYCWNGTFVAHNDSGVCLQILANGTIVGKEDCLTLDVITPYVRYDNPLPVVVLIGSETLMGGSPSRLRPSARYARSRDVVFVRPNFRLGALGFMALDVLAESDYPKTSGNYGLSDIVAALNWVQLNIEHFGGNKRAVTVFGHRAGATLVTALTAVRGARKYFARAWASSGSAVYPEEKDASEQRSENRKFLDAVRCEDAKCLREMDAETLVAAVEDTWRKPFLDLPSVDEKPRNRHRWLIVEGRLLKSYTEGIWDPDADVDLPVNLIIGTTAHSSSSEKLLMKHKHWTEDLVKQHMLQSVVTSSDANNITAMYPLNYEGLSRMISDIRIVCPLLGLSQRLKLVPFYVVTQTRFAEAVADIDSDIDAILGRYEPRTPEQRRYFSALQGLFYHYVWDGIVEQNLIGQRVLIVDQDIQPNSSYSWCDYWTRKNVVPAYAALD